MSNLQKVIFIASLQHSGSTMLDMFLGTLPKVIGLGEIGYFIRTFPRSAESVCSCGKTASDCPVWGKVIEKFKSKDRIILERGYSIIISIFKDIFGKEAILVDSSKYIPNLSCIHKLPNTELSVIYLLKDVRNFTISMIDRAKENNVKASAVKQYLNWHKQNIKIYDFLKNKNIKYLQIGYEEIVLQPDQSSLKLSEYIKLPVMQDCDITLTKTKSHIITGNRMRYQKRKNKIRYDYRWFERNEWFLPTLLFPNIMRYNNKNVYSNCNNLYIR